MLLGFALAGMQTLIGGTRLVFSLPVYALLAVVGLLSLVASWAKPAAARFCLLTTAMFFGYLLARGWFSPVFSIARTDIFSILGGLVVYLFTACVFTSPKKRIYLLLLLILVALVQVAIGAIQFRDGNNFMLIPFLQRFDYGRRASGFYVCPNHFAGLLEVLAIYCLSLACWSRLPVWAKMLIAYAGAICLAGLALTGSRGGYLSASFGLVVFALLTLLVLRQAGTQIFWRTFFAGVICVLLLGAAVFVGFKNSSLLSTRAQAVFDTENMRVDLWRAALTEWKLRPFVGTGSGTYLYYGRRFRTERVQLDPVEVHNDFLHLLCEYGAVGGLACLLFLGAHLSRGWHAFQRLGPRRVAASHLLPSNSLALNLGSLGAVAAFLVHSAFDFNLHIPANVLLLAFVFGILAYSVPDSVRTEPRLKTDFFFGRIALPILALLLAAACVRYLPAEYAAERSRTALRDERHVTAMLWANKALALDRTNPETWFYLGESRVRRAENQRSAAARASFENAALAPFQHAHALAPNDETFLIALGRVYDSLGRYPEADWMFGEALAWDPRSEVTQKSYAAHLDFWKRSAVPLVAPPELQLPDQAAPLVAPSATPPP